MSCCEASARLNSEAYKILASGKYNVKFYYGFSVIGLVGNHIVGHQTSDKLQNRHTIVGVPAGKVEANRVDQ